MGKPGLWEFTTHADMNGLMASITPEQRAKMKAMGIDIPENSTFTFSRCVTPQESAMIKPPPIGRPGHEKDCKLENLKTTSSSASADMVCGGDKINGSGHFEMAYDSPEHYAGHVSMNVEHGGQRVKTAMSFEAKWLGSDCKAK